MSLTPPLDRMPDRGREPGSSANPITVSRTYDDMHHFYVRMLCLFRRRRWRWLARSRQESSGSWVHRRPRAGPRLDVGVFVRIGLAGGGSVPDREQLGQSRAASVLRARGDRAVEPRPWTHAGARKGVVEAVLAGPGPGRWTGPRRTPRPRRTGDAAVHEHVT